MPEEQKTDQKTPEERESERILKRVKHESETVGRSSMKRVVDDLGSHLKAEDADQNEWAEVWGTRIGRVLGMIFFVVLVIYLLQTYVLN